jgi:hypothetical protein
MIMLAQVPLQNEPVDIIAVRPIRSMEILTLADQVQR